MSRSHYETLGLSTAASREEVKRAYRALILKYHPDKTNGVTNARFMEVQEAYRMICRDGAGSTPQHESDNAIRCFDLQSIVQIIWFLYAFLCQQAASLNNHHIKDTYVHSRPSDIVVQCPVTLKDLYLCKMKKIVVKVKRWNAVESLLVETKQRIYISTWNFVLKHVFPNMGDDGLGNDEKKDRSHIVVNLLISTHPFFSLDAGADGLKRFDLYCTHDVNLLDYYQGFRLKLTHLDGETIETVVPPMSAFVVLPGVGLPFYDEEEDCEKRGDLTVHLNLKLPVLDICNKVPEFIMSLKKYYDDSSKSLGHGSIE
jgi:hypothetical protein